jgi:hypothetical protein
MLSLQPERQLRQRWTLAGRLNSGSKVNLLLITYTNPLWHFKECYHCAGLLDKMQYSFGGGIYSVNEASTRFYRFTRANRFNRAGDRILVTMPDT